MKHSLWVFLFVLPSLCQVVITVDSVVGPVTYKGSGFLGGFHGNAPAESLVAPLKVRFQRAGEDEIVSSYQRCKTYGAQQEVVTGVWSGWNSGRPNSSNWSSWEQYHRDFVTRMNSKGMGGVSYSIWNDADYPSQWPDFFEAYKRAYSAIRSVNPNAVIVGPNTVWGANHPSWWYSAHPGDYSWYVRQFLDYCLANNCLPNIVAYHDWSDSGTNVITVYNDIQAYFSNKKMTPLPFEEDDFGSEPNQFKPGSFCSYLANIERCPNIIRSAKCWWSDDGWTDKLNGLLTSDNQKRSLWWMYKAYADITGQIVMVTPAPNLAIDGVAGVNQDTIRCVLGRYSSLYGPFSLTFNKVNVPKLQITGYRIKNSGTSAMPSPGKSFDLVCPATNNSVSISISDLNEYDAYQIVAIPTTANPALVYEAENLTQSASSPATKKTAENNASGGYYVEFNGTATTGSYMEFVTPSVAPATYAFKMFFKSNTNRGVVQTSVDGVNLGGTCDEYRTTAAHQVMFDIGTRALSAGTHTIRFTVTGKNASSSGYTMTVDKIEMGSSAQNYTLTVSGSNGSVSLNPAGGTYASGTVVTLTASPTAGFRFIGWSGDLSGTANPATITMNANKSVTADFEAIPQFTITTTAANGTISLNPAGGTYYEGTVVTVSATPDLGYKFTGWSEDLSGTTNPATIAMTGNKSVTANFISIPTYTLTASAANGSVSLNPAGGTYNEGTVVTLTATPAAGYAFNGWSGDLTGTANPAAITMSGNKNVTANFIVSQVVTTYEGESLTRSTSTFNSTTVVSDTRASGGKYVQLAGLFGVKTGNWVEFTTPSLVAGTYQISMYFKSGNNLGIHQASIDGVNQGSPRDEYAATAAYLVESNLGSKALAAGTHKIRFTVTGKRAASSGYTLTIDKIVLGR